MKTKQTKLALAVVATLLSTLLIGCGTSSGSIEKAKELSEKDWKILPSEEMEYGVFYARQGDTIFVSGHIGEWGGRLSDTLYGHQELREGLVYSDGSNSEPLTTIVFVDMKSPRHQEKGLVNNLAAFIKKQGLTTALVGRCDNACAEVFLAGKNRLIGQTLDGQEPYFVLQPSLAYEKFGKDTKRVESRFPEAQLGALEFAYEGMPQSLKKQALRAYSELRDSEGRLQLNLESASYCVNASDCTAIEGMNAINQGLFTSSERRQWVLPKRFPAPDILVVSSPEELTQGPWLNPTKKQRKLYADFLNYPFPRALAISNENDGEHFSWSYGGKWPAAASALKECEKDIPSQCRLAVYDKTVISQ